MSELVHVADQGGVERGSSSHRSGFDKTLVVQAYLQEYETTWTELFARWENQRQAFNYVITIIALSVGLAFSADVDLPPEFFFALPFIIAPFAFIFFDNELMIWPIVAYTRKHLQPRVQDLLDDRTLLMLENSRLKYLTGHGKRGHLTLSIGRWIIFVAPMVAAPIYAVVASRKNAHAVYHAIAVANILLVAYFFWIMWIAVVERKKVWE